jgi:integrase
MSRRRRDGTMGYTAQIRIKKGGKVIRTEVQTFDRKLAASAWIKKRETELAQPGALERPRTDDPTLGEVIDRYIKESKKEMGRTKAQVLGAIKGYDLANMKCSEVGSDEISAFANELVKERDPSTVGNYLSHLSAVFAVAKPLWKYPLNHQTIKEAMVALRKLGIIGKSKQRDRRPTLDELDKLMTHFGLIRARRPSSTPMQATIAFAIFSTRREDEITRIAWADLDEAHSRVMVRDMKHPGDKDGNDQWCDLTPEALKIVQAQPKTDACIFPYSTEAVCAAFTRACYTTGINTPGMPDKLRLHFHDLRHDGVSRLFEMGWNIPHAAGVSGHRSWQSLKRYTHIRQSGDKYAGWEWLNVVTADTLSRQSHGADQSKPQDRQGVHPLLPSDSPPSEQPEA